MQLGSDGIHKHKCGACGCVWEHPDYCADETKAHTCPKCHTMQWRKYFGPEPPTSDLSSIRIPKWASLQMIRLRMNLRLFVHLVFGI